MTYHVNHVFEFNERVIDGDNFNFAVFHSVSEDDAANTTYFSHTKIRSDPRLFIAMKVSRLTKAV